MVEIVASIRAAGVAEILRQARLAAMAGATWIELRLDDLPPPDARSAIDARDVLRNIGLPVMVSCRTREDGGGYTGTLAARRQLLQTWLAAGARGLDLEEWEEWTPPELELLDLYVRSHHDFAGVPEDLPAVRDRLLAQGAHVAKIAVTAHDLADAAPVMNLMLATDPEQQPTVAFAMGESTHPTRILACLLGAPLIYGSAGPDLATAPGQPPVEELVGIYDVRRISAQTSLYGVLGNPVRHSVGPMMHNRVFRLLEHDGIYLPFETSRPEAVLAMLPRRRLRGVSVTAPHKAVAGTLCHQFDDDAEAAEAVNTITFQAHGVVMGHNTDVAGVRGALERAGLSEGEGNAVVLGGGGAARAAATALLQMEMPVTLMPRSLDKVREFARKNGCQLARLDSTVLSELQPRVVVHATPVGGDSSPEGPGARLLPDWRPEPGTYVLDMVYRPRWTRLLRDVQEQGGIAVPGIEMFLTQASRQVALFCGRRVSEQVLASFLSGI